MSTLIRMDLSKNILIKANPGTGKTTALADRVVELIRNGVNEKDILCLTFTNKAVDEMFNKIIRKFEEYNIEQSRINNLTISTFHSFCNGYFSEIGKEFKIVNNNFIRFTIYKSLEKNKAFNYDNDYIIKELVPKIENSIRYIKSFGITPDSIDIKNTKEILIKSSFLENVGEVKVDEILTFLDYFIMAFKDYEISKDIDKIDYNDLLSRFLIEYDPLKKHYKYVLVDELQDLNDIEAEIAKLLGDYLFFVGDRKQSIFGFQGGSIKNFTEFEKLPNLEKFTKSLNYRSYNKILNYSKNYFLNKAKDKTYEQELKDFTGNLGDGGEVLQIIGNNVNNLAVKNAIELISKDKKTAIITRTNEQIVEISRILDSKNIRYLTTASASVSARAKNAVIDYLKGLFYKDEHDILKALFTPFSGLSLREAFIIEEKYRKKETDYEGMKKLAKPFFNKLSVSMNLYDVNKIFNDTILPISISLGNDYYVTASSILESINEYFDNTDIPNLNDMLAYIYTAEESYEPVDSNEPLILTTVHKAKGLEFDNVVYVPKKQNKKTTFIDLVTNSIINGTKNIDVGDELSEEGLRVDFVAFTRAKERLIVITDTALAEEYYIDGFIDKKIDEMEDEIAPFQRRYEEAYSLFVNKRYDESKKLLEDNDKWLTEKITNYFKNSIKMLSFSLIDSLHNPFNFVKYQILKIEEITPAVKFGLKAHEIAENYFKGTLKEEELNEDEIKILQNIKKINEEIKAKYKAEQIGAEKTLEFPIQTVFPEFNKELKIKAKLDAIFFNKEKNKLLIIDFKTDKSDSNGSKHRRQLGLYRRMLAISEKMDEKDIDTAIAYINLTGNINTGRLDYKLDTQKIKDSSIETFKEHLSKLISFIDDPSKFIEMLAKKPYMPDNVTEEIFKEIHYESSLII